MMCRIVKINIYTSFVASAMDCASPPIPTPNAAVADNNDAERYPNRIGISAIPNINLINCMRIPPLGASPLISLTIFDANLFVSGILYLNPAMTESTKLSASVEEYTSGFINSANPFVSDTISGVGINSEKFRDFALDNKVFKLSFLSENKFNLSN